MDGLPAERQDLLDLGCLLSWALREPEEVCHAGARLAVEG